MPRRWVDLFRIFRPLLRMVPIAPEAAPRTVYGMSAHCKPPSEDPSLSVKVCQICQHSEDDHILALIPTGHPDPMGLVSCPEPLCGCASTWRAGTHPSTPEEIAETRMLVRETLARSGLTIPSFLL